MGLIAANVRAALKRKEECELVVVNQDCKVESNCEIRGIVEKVDDIPGTRAELRVISLPDSFLAEHTTRRADKTRV